MSCGQWWDGHPVKYDDASYHLGDSTSEEVAAAHIGLFFRWCLISGLVSEEHTAEPELASQLKKVRDGRLSGAKYLWENTSGKLADVDLTEEGNRFSKQAYGKYCKKLHELVAKPDHQ